MAQYKIGVGKASVTYRDQPLGMQGFGDIFQMTEDGEVSEGGLSARAFVVQTYEGEQLLKTVVLVVADLWGFSDRLKNAILEQLKARNYGIEANELMLLASHTHSGPGGYTGYTLYDISVRGEKQAKQENFQTIVNGIVEAIRMAYRKRAIGNLYWNRGELENCGYNRSLMAYLNNDIAAILDRETEAVEEKRIFLEQYQQSSRIRKEALVAQRRFTWNATDKRMTILKFTQLEGNMELPVGMISWYALHPTDRQQYSHYISGDNKGYAAILFEDYMDYECPRSKDNQDAFVAAFANSNAGDISGNRNVSDDLAQDGVQLAEHAMLQEELAKALFEGKLGKLRALEPKIQLAYKKVDLTAVHLDPFRRTWPATVGLSMLAGSREDGDARTGLREGLVQGTVGNCDLPFKQALDAFAKRQFIWPISATSVVLAELKKRFEQLPEPPLSLIQLQKAHYPKPIALITGKMAPSELPIQLVQLGDLLLTGIPSEMTAMAGLQLEVALLKKAPEVKALVLACYANDYAQYITTKGEYEMQHYEGASTLFGPHTLAAYVRVFEGLLKKLK